MSLTVYEEKDFTKLVPKRVKEETKRNMEQYHVSLCDAFEWAVRDLAKKGTELWKAWYYGDFRKFCPAMYYEEYLNFEKYPLKYENIS